MNRAITHPATSNIPNRACSCAVLRSTGLSATGSESVATRRISDSAIGSVNPEVVPEWKNELDKIAQPYRERLDDLKAGMRSGFPLSRE